MGLGFRVSGVGFTVGFVVQGVGFKKNGSRVYGLGCRVYSRVRGSGCRVQKKMGLGFRV